MGVQYREPAERTVRRHGDHERVAAPDAIVAIEALGEGGVLGALVSGEVLFHAALLSRREVANRRYAPVAVLLVAAPLGAMVGAMLAAIVRSHVAGLARGLPAASLTIGLAAFFALAAGALAVAGIRLLVHPPRATFLGEDGAAQRVLVFPHGGARVHFADVVRAERRVVEHRGTRGAGRGRVRTRTFRLVLLARDGRVLFTVSGHELEHGGAAARPLAFAKAVEAALAARGVRVERVVV